MIGKNPNPLSLEERWDLEEKYTAFVGRPTGANITRPVVQARPQGAGVVSKATGKRESRKGPSAGKAKANI
jgi:hypothetical protein